jgi:hypothetical protein
MLWRRATSVKLCWGQAIFLHYRARRRQGIVRGDLGAAENEFCNVRCERFHDYATVWNLLSRAGRSCMILESAGLQPYKPLAGTQTSDVKKTHVRRLLKQRRKRNFVIGLIAVASLDESCLD